MDLEHAFTVEAPVDTVWTTMVDIEGVAECFPGATVTSVEGDSFSGTCKVKLGPIALVYKGSGSFVERDDSGHRAVIEAKGKHKRGNGTAGVVLRWLGPPPGQRLRRCPGPRGGGPADGLAQLRALCGDRAGGLRPRVGHGATSTSVSAG